MARHISRSWQWWYNLAVLLKLVRGIRANLVVS